MCFNLLLDTLSITSNVNVIVFYSAGEAPPNYLPPDPPVIHKVLKSNQFVPSLVSVEPLVADYSPVLLVKGKAPLPPTSNRPPVPKRSPMRRSLSVQGEVPKQRPVFNKNTNINHTFDECTKNVSYKSSTSNKQKFFSIKKARPENSVSNVVPQSITAPTFSDSERNNENAHVVDGCDQVKAKLGTDKFKVDKSHTSTPADCSTTTTTNKTLLLPPRSVNNDKGDRETSSLPFFYLSSTFDSSNVATAPVYCPVYSKPTRLRKNLDINSNSCELKVDALLSPVFSKKLCIDRFSRDMSEPTNEVVTLEGFPLGTESLV